MAMRLTVVLCKVERTVKNKVSTEHLNQKMESRTTDDVV